MLAALRAHTRAYTMGGGATGHYHGIRDYRRREMVEGLLFSFRCCSFQLADEEGEHLSMLQGKLCSPF